MEWEEEMLEKHQFYIHYVIDADLPYKVDIHTHGLRENFDHPNLQIVLPLDEKNAKGILHAAANFIKDGGCFLPNKTYSKLLKGAFEIKFVKAVNHGEEILRMIIPDKLNNLSYDKMDQEYKKQYLARFKKESETSED